MNNAFCKAVYLCSLSYNKNAKRILVKKGYRDITIISQELYSGFICVDKNNKCYVVLSGIDPGTFIKSASKLLYYNHKVTNDKGIYIPFINRAVEVAKIISQYSNQYTTVYIGHSLGGAILTALSAYIKPQMLITFGSPKVGNKHFVRVLDEVKLSHFRFTCCNDDIIMLPLVPTLCHHGVEIYINYYGHVRESTKFQKLKDYIRAKTSLIQVSAAHNIDNYYVKVLKAYKDEYI